MKLTLVHSDVILGWCAWGVSETPRVYGAITNMLDWAFQRMSDVRGNRGGDAWTEGVGEWTVSVRDRSLTITNMPLDPNDADVVVGTGMSKQEVYYQSRVYMQMIESRGDAQ